MSSILPIYIFQASSWHSHEQNTTGFHFLQLAYRFRSQRCNLQPPDKLSSHMCMPFCSNISNETSIIYSNSSNRNSGWKLDGYLPHSWQDAIHSRMLCSSTLTWTVQNMVNSGSAPDQLCSWHIPMHFMIIIHNQ